MKYGEINNVYKSEITSQILEEDTNKKFLKSKNIQSNWQYRDFLTHDVKVTNHTNEVANIDHNRLYYRLEDVNTHNKSDLKNNYINNLKTTFYKIAPAIH